MAARASIRGRRQAPGRSASPDPGGPGTQPRPRVDSRAAGTLHRRPSPGCPRRHPAAARARRAAIPVRAILPLAVLLAGTVPAAAHAILMASDPPVQGQLPAGTEQVTLRYNSRVDHARSSLVLTRPDGTTQRLPVAGGSAADALATEVALAPGAYSLRWQVLATDGHITRGDVPFTVLPAGTAPAAAAAQTAAKGP